MPGRRLLGLAVVFALLSLSGWGLFRVYRIFKPDQHGAKVTHFTLESNLVGRPLGEIVVTPKGGGTGRPLLVLLHGRGSSPSSYLAKYWFDALAKLGSRAPDLLLVNGGDHSYYHDRADGRWGSYVVREAIPAALVRTGADRSRIAIGGISMGGFGALSEGLRHPGAFCAIGGHSAALWRTGGETPQGAFDNAEDFVRNDVIKMASSRQVPLGRNTRVWIDVGNQDPFASADSELVRALRARGQKVVFHSWPGAHSGSYWNRHVAQYLRFYADALATC
ncbi:MAG TPA: alpha/beta hydrolase-fold protein [Gaiellaceae bacterium]